MFKGSSVVLCGPALRLGEGDVLPCSSLGQAPLLTAMRSGGPVWESVSCTAALGVFLSWTSGSSPSTQWWEFKESIPQLTAHPRAPC